jgi:DNA-binding FrmR family transcriptional regulator
MTVNAQQRAEAPPGYHDARGQVLARLRRIEGQVRGLQRMVDEDRYCIDILTQIAAADAALRKVALALLAEHLRHCVLRTSDGVEERTGEVIAATARLLGSG